MQRKRRARIADTGARVYSALRERAITFVLRPGEHVNEVALANELSVSRTPVREALNRLASEGLMTFVPNKGFFRRALDIDHVRSLFEIRSGLELLAVRLCCARAEASELEKLAEEWAGVKKRRRELTVSQVATCDAAFHEGIADCTRNKELAQFLRDINSRIHFFRLIAMETLHVRKMTFGEHDEILEALFERDEKKACERMETHISITLDDVTRMVKESVARIYLGQAEP